MRPHLVAWLSRLVGGELAEALAPSYFTCAALAALLGAVLLVRRARRDGDDVAALLRALTWGYTAAIVGGMLVPFGVDLLRQLLAGGPVRPRWAGMVAYAGFGCGFGAAALVLRRDRRVSFARFADLCAAPVGVAIAVVRLGCFLAGCDYGKVTSSFLGLRFPAGSPAFDDHVRAGLVPAWRGLSLPVHPTQLYEAAVGLLVSLAAWRIARRRPRPGLTFVAAAAVYGVGRFAVEALRGDASRGAIGPFSTSQALSLVVLAACVAVALRRPLVRAAVTAAVVGVLLAAAPTRADGLVPGGRGFDLGLLVGMEAPLNRPADQVPALVAVNVMGAYTFFAPFGVAVELEMASNSVATHTTLAVALSFRQAVVPKVEAYGRAGLGGTSIHFKDASFANVGAFDWRMAAGVAFNVAEHWQVLVEPLDFDVQYATEVAGYIVGYRFFVGVAWNNRRGPGAVAPAPANLPLAPTPY